VGDRAGGGAGVVLRPLHRREAAWPAPAAALPGVGGTLIAPF